MVRSKRIQIYFILIFILGTIVFAQDKPGKVNKSMQLREEILAVYKSGGEQGLLNFVKKNKDKISNKFIIDFAEAGCKAINREWLKVCEVMAVERKDEKTLVEVLYNTGKYFRLVSDFQKAHDYFDKALPLFQKLNYLVEQGNIYHLKGVMFDRTGDKSKAFEMYDKALPIFKKTGDLIGQGNVCLSMGIIYLKIGKNSKALGMYDKALPFFEKAGDLLGQGNIYLFKGEVNLLTGENSNALGMYDKAQPFFKKEGDLVGQGNILLRKGDIYSRIGENSKAIEMYDEAFPFFINGISRGQLYERKGDIYRKFGEYSKAHSMFEKALPFFEKAGYTTGQGNLYQNKGIIYFINGNNLKAIEMYNKALRFYEKAGGLLGQGTIHLRKGYVYLSIGEKSKALEMYDKALHFHEDLGNPGGQGYVYSGMGQIYSSIGDNNRALEMLDKALPFFKKIGDPIGLGGIYSTKGSIYSKIGDKSRALEMLDKALPFFEKTGEPVGQSDVWNEKGAIYLSIGKHSIALEMYNKALVFCNRARNIKLKSNALLGKAKVLVKLEKKEHARELFEKGIAHLEKVRNQTAFSEMKRTFMEKVYQQYEETVLFMLENTFYEKGFKYAESMRARVFLDRMAEGWVRPDKGLTPGMKEKRDKLVTKLSRLSKEMHETAEEKENKKLLELKDQYHKVESELEDLLVEIRLNNPLYARVRYPQPISVQALQKKVLKKNEMLIRYFISPGKTYAFLVSRGTFDVFTFDIKEKEINNTVGVYLRALKEKNADHIRRYGNTLYRELFKPLEPGIKKNKEIIIIPDGQLATIPFESLIIHKKKSGRPVFLLEKYRIKYIQSASLLSILRKHYRGDSETKNFIGFGDPVYDYESFKKSKPVQAALTGPRQPKDEIKQVLRSRYARSGGTFDRLPASGEEVHAIARLFKKYAQKATVFSRAQANEEKAKAPGMKDFDYIHFACHGLLNENFQSLVLSQLPRDQSTEDGYFTLNEIMNCDYRAKLIVLSACQTGSGKMERAEGVTGLTRAVMYAGTPAVVASLWNVDDQATKELMLHFYRNLLEKDMDKAEALRQAKLELLKNKKYRSPLFWSAFVMYGE